jgi:hypothetical protein
LEDGLQLDPRLPLTHFAAHEVCIDEDLTGKSDPSGFYSPHLCSANGSVMKSTFSGAIHIDKTKSGLVVRHLWIADSIVEEKMAVFEHPKQSDSIKERIEAWEKHESETLTDELAQRALAQELKKSGAKFSPLNKEEFLRTLPIKSLEQFVGKFRIESVYFQALHWKVEANALSDGRKVKYKFFFEPFDGKLIEIHSDVERVSRMPDFCECNKLEKPAN